jgi:hypothetical protein
MPRPFFAFLLSVFLSGQASAQVVPASKGVQLYVPRDAQLAYRRGTRSPDGRPGPNYWQNHGRYEITINAAPPDRTIRGTEKITYFNNSPDTLKVIDFRLIVNIHKPGITRLGNEDSTYLNPGIRIDSYSENGQEHPWRNQDHDGTWNSSGFSLRCCLTTLSGWISPGTIWPH